MFLHRAGDGTETDVSEGVAALYDLVINSMDWGSGFWSWEDALPVAVIGRLGGFKEIEEVERYIRDRKHDAETTIWRRDNRAAYDHWGDYTKVMAGFSHRDLIDEVVPHDHVFSSVGRCMWPRCRAQEEVPVS